MKILFDHQIFEFQRFGGISRYFFELINHLENDKDVQWELPVSYSDNEYLKSLPGFGDKILPKSEKVDHYKKFLWGTDFRGKGMLYRIKKKLVPEPFPNKESEINKTKTIEVLRQGHFDIFHPTYYDDYFLEHIEGKPFVLTVYDLIHQIFPEFGLYEKMDKNKDLLQRASTIIAISESTKSDLINIFNIDEKKIVVTHLASSLRENGSEVGEDFKNKLPFRYLLFVGGREGYKNFLFFAQVVAALTGEEKDLCVVCTGSPFNEKELYLFNKTGITERMVHTYVNDNELSYLYRNAAAFVFPSMYEGFGLPVLEAFSCGCPVLVSNTSSLIEIGGDAVIYFDPKNPASMIRAIKGILTNVELRIHNISKGYEQVKKFSWQKTADETKTVYQEIVSAKTL